MANFDFTLKSGKKLHITTAPFEDAISLVEAVKRATAGLDPSLEVTDIVLTNPDVRKALYGVFQYAMYDTQRVSPALFDDPKWRDLARGDYFEICSRLIEVNSKPFFLRTTSASSDSPPPPTKNPESS